MKKSNKQNNKKETFLRAHDLTPSNQRTAVFLFEISSYLGVSGEKLNSEF